MTISFVSDESELRMICFALSLGIVGMCRVFIVALFCGAVVSRPDVYTTYSENQCVF